MMNSDFKTQELTHNGAKIVNRLQTKPGNRHEQMVKFFVKSHFHKKFLTQNFISQNKFRKIKIICKGDSIS